MLELLALVVLAVLEAKIRIAGSWRRWHEFRAKHPRLPQRTHQARLIQWNGFTQPTRWDLKVEPRGSVWTENP